MEVIVKISRIQEILGAQIIAGNGDVNDEVKYGYGCDLMSDVLAYVQSDVVLLTGLVHPQVIRTAEMLDIKAIVIVRGKIPSEELIAMADRKDIVLVRTIHSLFLEQETLLNPMTGY
jgi:predicted transcriptional regulator